MTWPVALCRVLYGLLVFMVGSLWFGVYYMLRGVAVTAPVLAVGDPTLGVYESSLSTYEMTMGAHLLLSLLAVIVMAGAGALALLFWWLGFRTTAENPTKSLLLGMIVILFPLPFMGTSGLKTLPYAGEIYEGALAHKGPVTIRFNPDGTHEIIPLE